MTVSVVEKKPNKALNILPKTWVKRWTEHSNVQLSEEDVDYIVTNTAISRDQIEKQFEVFITNHPDGRISKKSFRKTANNFSLSRKFMPSVMQQADRKSCLRSSERGADNDHIDQC